MYRVLFFAGVISAFSAVANAGVISFDPDGGGGTAPVSIIGFDYQPGNSLADGGNAAVATYIATGGTSSDPAIRALAVQTPFTLFFQTQLANFQLAGGGGTLSPVSGTEITIVLGFQEIVTSFTPVGPGGVATFGLAPIQTNNFFEIYFDTTPDAIPLLGTGFNDGTLIMSGTIGANSGSFLNFTGATSTGPLDQSGSNDYPAIGAIGGTGGASISGNVGFYDPAFFVGLPSGVTIAISTFSTDQSLPFRLVDPSGSFVEAPGGGPSVVDGAGLGAASLGTVNGAPLGSGGGPDIQIQTDATQSFATTPEPGAIAIWSLAFSGMGLARIVRRRRAA